MSFWFSLGLPYPHVFVISYFFYVYGTFWIWDLLDLGNVRYEVEAFDFKKKNICLSSLSYVYVHIVLV